MEKLDELVGGQSSPAQQLASRRPLPWLRKRWDVLAVLLLLLASFPVQWLLPRTLFLTGATVNLIDDSWILDASFKASRGVWFGRDVTFNYGPLFQWLSSAPARWSGLSIGTIYETWYTLPLWVSFLLGYLTLRLLLPEQEPWKRFLLLLLLSVFRAPLEGRGALEIFLFALFLRGWYRVKQASLRPAVLGCGAALSCVAAFLYSADVGVQSVAALLISLAGVAWEGRHESHTVRSFASALLVFAVLSLVLVISLNAIMVRPLDFRFWKTSLTLVSVYRWSLSSSMSKAGKIQLLATSLAGGAIFLLRRAVPEDRAASFAARTGFLLSAFAFAFLGMQAGLVRADDPHIFYATFPMVFLAGTVLFSFRARTVSALAACSILLFGQPTLSFQPSGIRDRYAQLRHPLMECPKGFTAFDRACYPAAIAGMLQTGASYLQQRSGPRDSMVVFPYLTLFGIAAHRNVAGGLMQSLLANGPYLSQVDIAGLERAAAPVGLYLPDGNLSTPIDGVPNFTRSPEVWLWMFRHYRGEQQLVPGVFGLQRDDSRAVRITSQSRSLNAALQSYPVRKRSSVLDLGGIVWPSDGADFVRLRIKVHYNPWWKLRKPARLVLEIDHADGSYERKPFVVEPNVSSEVWFYPWDDAELAPYFDAEETHWRTGSRPAVARLRLLVMPLDWVSVQPDMIEVQSADSVRVGLNP